MKRFDIVLAIAVFLIALGIATMIVGSYFLSARLSCEHFIETYDNKAKYAYGTCTSSSGKRVKLTIRGYVEYDKIKTNQTISRKGS